tara:strand:- start:112351 stop:113355 length:1005 start_codon:yes stop_codon:yes gene_type:complete
MTKSTIVSSLEMAPPVRLGVAPSTEGISDIFNNIREAFRSFMDKRIMKRGKITERDLNRLMDATRTIRRHVKKTYANERWVELKFQQIETFTISNQRALYSGDKFLDMGILEISDEIYKLSETLEQATKLRSKYIASAIQYIFDANNNGIHITKGVLLDFYSSKGNYKDVLKPMERSFPHNAPMAKFLVHKDGYLNYVDSKKVHTDEISRPGMTVTELQTAGKNLLALLDSVINSYEARWHGIFSEDDISHLVEIGYGEELDLDTGKVNTTVYYEDIVPKVVELAKSTGDQDIIAIFSFESWNERHGDAMFHEFDLALEACKVLFESINQHIKD